MGSPSATLLTVLTRARRRTKLPGLPRERDRPVPEVGVPYRVGAKLQRVDALTEQ